MAEREPIVIISGQLRQLPSGDTLNIGYTPGGGGANISFVAANKSGETINKLAAVYTSNFDTDIEVSLATANDAATSKFVGFADANTPNGTALNVYCAGVVTGDTAEWDVVAGTTGGLTYNTLYYLDDTNPGQITPLPPTASGSYVKPVGLSLSTTKLLILQQHSILL